MDTIIDPKTVSFLLIEVPHIVIALGRMFDKEPEYRLFPKVPIDLARIGANLLNRMVDEKSTVRELFNIVKTIDPESGMLLKLETCLCRLEEMRQDSAAWNKYIGKVHDMDRGCVKDIPDSLLQETVDVRCLEEIKQSSIFQVVIGGNLAIIRALNPIFNLMDADRMRRLESEDKTLEENVSEIFDSIRDRRMTLRSLFSLLTKIPETPHCVRALIEIMRDLNP
jgi:Fe-S-cluster formation regulator IscX/YfhJ